MRRQGNDEYKGQHHVPDQWELPLQNLFSKSSCGGGGGGGARKLLQSHSDCGLKTLGNTEEKIRG